MIVTSRTPLRVSLFGGGSDYPDWYRHTPGAVLGFTIDKYIYISALRLPSFIDYTYRLSYSKLETGHDFTAIEHSAIREVLARSSFTDPVDIGVQADLPANSGLGSSSAFTVGFLHLISALTGVRRTTHELADLAIDVEQNVLKERVGVQDQLHATFGGINRFDFHGDDIAVKPLRVEGATIDRLDEWLMLVYTGIKRHASATLTEQIENTASRKLDRQLQAMVDLVGAGERVFATSSPDELPHRLAELLREGWAIKRQLSASVTSPAIDELHDLCLDNGALAAKLCGAGAGGFLLALVDPERRDGFVEALGPERCIPICVELSGSAVWRQK
jgi:D-glycero-alpha-D-manno-heptose-7-phosphate kinase